MSPAANTIALTPRVTGVVLAVAGAAFVALSVLGVLNTNSFISRAKRGEATVVSLYAGSSHPKFEFVDPNGEKLSFYGTGWISHRVGDRVPVLFLDSDSRKTVKLDEPGALWFLPGAFGFFGGAALLTGLAVLVRSNRNQGN
jgi:hypothetical protein